jgi:hypothetical protein
MTKMLREGGGSALPTIAAFGYSFDVNSLLLCNFPEGSVTVT